MSPRFALGRENVPCVAEVVNRSLKADCTDYTTLGEMVGLHNCAVPDKGSINEYYRDLDKAGIKKSHDCTIVQLPT